MAADRHLLGGGEEAHLHVILSRFSREEKRRLRVVQLPGDAPHLLVGEAPGVQHHPGGIARELFLGKGVHLIDRIASLHGCFLLYASWPAGASFWSSPAARHIFCFPK